MAVTTALRELHAAATRLRDAIRELEVIAVEDSPRSGDVYLVEIVHHAAFELSGAAEQAVAALDPEATTGTAGGCRSVGCTVADFHLHVNTLGTTLVRHLAGPERLAELAGLSAYGPEPKAWSREVARGVATCQDLLWTDLLPALQACWVELVEHPPLPGPPATGPAPAFRSQVIKETETT